MPTFDVQTNLVVPEGDTFGNYSITDEVVELPALPEPDAVLDDLAVLRSSRDDGEGAAYRRVFIAQSDPDDNGDRFFTVVALDVTLQP